MNHFRVLWNTTPFRDQLKVLLLDLYVAWATDPELSIGISMSVSAWDTSSRYNALHLSKVMIQLVRRLAEVGLIDLAKGSYSGPGHPRNRVTRIRAYGDLVDLFAEARFELHDVIHSPDRETIILRNDDGADGRSKPVEYDDTADTNRMREELRAYNALLADTFIDIRDLDRPFVERDITTGPRAGTVQRVPIGPTNAFVRRVFSRGRWDLNGRFYGGWWQQIDRERRNLICLDRTPTVEVDYKGLHVAILAAGKGVPVTGDPYLVPPGIVDGIDEQQQRDILKMLVLTALNAASTKAAYRAFRDGFPAGSRAKSLKDTELERFLAAFTDRHPYLADALGTDQGIRLMYRDSQIAERIINHFTERGMPVLCIHDSFIIDHRYSDKLRTCMENVALELFEMTFAVSQDYAGIDQFLSNPDNSLETYVHHRDFPPYSAGFNHRAEEFRKRKRREERRNSR